MERYLFALRQSCASMNDKRSGTNTQYSIEDKDYDEYRTWLGVDGLDLSMFDLADMNYRLKKLPTIFVKSYERRAYLTKRSIDLIERKYIK